MVLASAGDERVRLWQALDIITTVMHAKSKNVQDTFGARLVSRACSLSQWPNAC